MEARTEEIPLLDQNGISLECLCEIMNGLYEIGIP